jgi:hypothetical protein
MIWIWYWVISQYSQPISVKSVSVSSYFLQAVSANALTPNWRKRNKKAKMCIRTQDCSSLQIRGTSVSVSYLKLSLHVSTMTQSSWMWHHVKSNNNSTGQRTDLCCSTWTYLQEMLQECHVGQLVTSSHTAHTVLSCMLLTEQKHSSHRILTLHYGTI